MERAGTWILNFCFAALLMKINSKQKLRTLTSGFLQFSDPDIAVAYRVAVVLQTDGPFAVGFVLR